MTRGRLGVVSAAHVRRGVELGIAQINHGKRTPYQHFTAIGSLPDDDIWQADEGSFKPFRRRIDYLPGIPTPLDALRARLHLTQEADWGYQLRYGLIPLDTRDVQTIREAMGT